MDSADLLRHWRFRAHRVQRGHYVAGRRYEHLHLWLGVPAVILGAIVGTAVFSSLAQSEISVPVTIAVGFLSVASAALAALQTFLKYSELAEKHKLAGARFADLKHKIELVAVFRSNDVAAMADELSRIEEQWSTIREESPNIPSKIWDSVERDLTFEKDLKTHPSFGQRFDDGPKD